MLGDRIRRLRLSRAISVRGLAAEAGLSPALISQVERGINDPSLDTLRRLAVALGTSLSYFFEDPIGPAVAVVRAGERETIVDPHGGIPYSRVSSRIGKLEVLEGVLAPHSVSTEQLWSHEAEECVIVTSGGLIVDVGGSSYELNAGDSCYFDSRNPHRYRNDRPSAVVFMVSTTPPSFDAEVIPV